MTPWKCGVCGEFDRNRESDKHCYFCGRMRGTWVCRWCGWKHCETSKACKECGQKKGTSPPYHSG